MCKNDNNNNNNTVRPFVNPKRNIRPPPPTKTVINPSL